MTDTTQADREAQAREALQATLAIPERGARNAAVLRWASAHGAAFATPPAGSGASSIPAGGVGWKLVPVEPTYAMLTAGNRDLGFRYESQAIKSLWSAMLAAAPTTPIAGGAGLDDDPPGDMTAARVDQGASEALGEMVWHVPSAPPPVQAGEVERPNKLKRQYPDYIDDPDGLERFRNDVKTTPGHDMAAVNHNSLGRLIDTIDRLRFERDQALSTPVSQPIGGGIPHATNAMLDAGVGEMRVSTHADRGVALDVWNAMHRASGIEARIRAEDLLAWLADCDNLVLFNNPAGDWEVRRGRVDGQLRGSGSTPSDALAAALRQSGAVRGETA